MNIHITPCPLGYSLKAEFTGASTHSSLCQCNSANNPAILTCENERILFVVYMSIIIRHMLTIIINNNMRSFHHLNSSRRMCGPPRTHLNRTPSLSIHVQLGTASANWRLNQRSSCVSTALIMENLTASAPVADKVSVRTLEVHRITLPTDRDTTL